MTLKPLVSIVIPVYNGSNYLKEAIDSALAQTYKNIEVIVVNDGSNDNGKTREIALSYGKQIRYFEKENGGVSTALNLAIENMKGEYFSWLSHDDLYLPRKIEASVEAILASDDKTCSALCVTDHLVMPEHKIEREVINVDKKYWENGISAYLIAPAMGCALLIHRSYFDKYGLFDSKQSITQDYSKWFEFYKENNLVFVPEHLVLMRCHSNQRTFTLSEDYKKENTELINFVSNNVPMKKIESLKWNLYNFYSVYLTARFMVEYLPAWKNIISKMRKLSIDSKDNTNLEMFHKFLRKISFGTNKTVLYCAGKKLERVAFALISREISVDGYSDSNPDKVKSERNGLKPIPPDKLNKDTDLIIITKNFPSDVKKSLMEQGFKHIYSYDEDIVGLLIEIPINKEFLDLYEKCC